jgi:hypothetical protein
MSSEALLDCQIERLLPYLTDRPPPRSDCWVASRASARAMKQPDREPDCAPTRMLQSTLRLTKHQGEICTSGAAAAMTD